MSKSNVSAKFEVSLRIRHQSADPEEVSRHVNYVPSFSYKAGEQRVTPKGRKLSGVNKETFWFLKLLTSKDQEISDVIRTANQRLTISKKYLGELTGTGGTIEYFIGLFVDKNAAASLDWQLLRECGELHINVVFDVYGPTTI